MPVQFRPNAGVRLSRGGLSVAENGSIDAFEGSLDYVLGDRAVDGFLLGQFCEDPVEGELKEGQRASAFEIGDLERAIVDLIYAAISSLNLGLQFTQRPHSDEDLYVVAALVHPAFLLSLYLILFRC